MKIKLVPVAMAAIVLLVGCTSAPQAKKKPDGAKPAARRLSTEEPEQQGKTVLAQWLAKRASGPNPANYRPEGMDGSRVAQPEPMETLRLPARAPSGPPPSGSSIVGHYEFELPRNPGQNKDPMAAMAEGFALMLVGSMELEMKPNSTFTMMVMGVSIDGRYDLEGSRVTLVPDKLMGLTPAEAKKLAAKTKGAGSQNRSLDGFEEPLIGTIASDFSSMTLHSGSRPKEAMAFRRKRPRTIGRATVSASESRLVGEWRLTADSAHSASSSAGTPEERRVAQSILSGFSLTLNRDNTYLMRIMMPMEGKWRADASSITLTPTSFMGMSLQQKGAQGNLQEPMEGRIAGDQSEIRFAPPNGKGPAMVFERSGEP